MKHNVLYGKQLRKHASAHTRPIVGLNPLRTALLPRLGYVQRKTISISVVRRAEKVGMLRKSRSARCDRHVDQLLLHGA